MFSLVCSLPSFEILPLCGHDGSLHPIAYSAPFFNPKYLGSPVAPLPPPSTSKRARSRASALRGWGSTRHDRPAELGERSGLKPRYVRLQQRRGRAVQRVGRRSLAFTKHGYKLITYHGWQDTTVSPFDSIADPDHNIISAPDRWVTSGVAPERAAGMPQPRVLLATAPLRLPQVSRYKGSGYSTGAENFKCAPAPKAKLTPPAALNTAPQYLFNSGAFGRRRIPLA